MWAGELAGRGDAAVGSGLMRGVRQVSVQNIVEGDGAEICGAAAELLAEEQADSDTVSTITNNAANKL